MNKRIAIFSALNGLYGYGESESFYKKLTNYANSQNLKLFVFTASEIDWKKKEINGNVWNGELWLKESFDFPIIIYDRVFSKIEKLNDIRLNLEKEGNRFFNGLGFMTIARDKLEFHELLSSREKNDLFNIPNSQEYSFNNLLDFLKEYKKVILKPRFGSQGQGIYLIELLENRNYKVFSEGKEFKEDNLLDFLEKNLNRKYLIQEYIDLVKYNNSIFDIRVLLQKNREGKVDFTGAVLRLSVENEICSNIHQGGEAMELKDVLFSVFSKEFAESFIKEKLLSTSMKLFEILDNRFTDEVSEIAMDFVLDKNSNLYILEINAKPGRRAFRVLGDNIHRESIQRPIDYMKYLLENEI